MFCKDLDGFLSQKKKKKDLAIGTWMFCIKLLIIVYNTDYDEVQV